MVQKIKHLFAVLLLAGFAAQPALANSIHEQDLAFAFGKTTVSHDLGDIALLSQQEMMETEGEWVGHVIRLGNSAWRGTKNIWSNTRFDGYNGSRVFQIRWKTKPVFRLDFKANPSPKKLHMHFGNMKYHRPWNAPWRRY